MSTDQNPKLNNFCIALEYYYPGSAPFKIACNKANENFVDFPYYWKPTGSFASKYHKLLNKTHSYLNIDLNNKSVIIESYFVGCDNVPCHRDKGEIPFEEVVDAFYDIVVQRMKSKLAVRYQNEINNRVSAMRKVLVDEYIKTDLQKMGFV